MKLSKIK